MAVPEKRLIVFKCSIFWWSCLFIRGDQNAIALAWLDEGRVVLGVLACPNLPLAPIGYHHQESVQIQVGFLFSARIGAGTEMQLFHGSSPMEVHVSTIENPAEASFFESFEAAHSLHGLSSSIAKNSCNLTPKYNWGQGFEDDVDVKIDKTSLKVVDPSGTEPYELSHTIPPNATEYIFQALRPRKACAMFKHIWLEPHLEFPGDLLFGYQCGTMNGEPEIVKNFLLKTLHLQGWEKQIDRFKLGEGAMPASFKVLHDPVRKTDTLIADFSESAIGRVAPVDSGFWWIILLRAYTNSTGDLTLAETPECQKGMRLVLTLCLSEGFDTFPTLLCAAGCSMIDRRMDDIQCSHPPVL